MVVRHPPVLIGLDNTGLFYDVPVIEKVPELDAVDNEGIDDANPDGHCFEGKIGSYVAEQNESGIDKLIKASKLLCLNKQV